MATTGVGLDTYLTRWLLISGAMLLISAVIYAIRLRRGIVDPEPMLRAAPEHETTDPVPTLWRVGAQLVLAGSALAILWVAAALVVGLLSTGFGG